MLAKGNRSKAVTDACKEHGGFYLGSIGGPAAAPRQGLHHQGRGARVPRARHGSGVEDRGASTSPRSSSSTTRATTSSAKCRNPFAGQTTLALERDRVAAAAVAADLAAGRDDAVARDHERQRVVAHRAARRPAPRAGGRPGRRARRRSRSRPTALRGRASRSATRRKPSMPSRSSVEVERRGACPRTSRRAGGRSRGRAAPSSPSGWSSPGRLISRRPRSETTTVTSPNGLSCRQSRTAKRYPRCCRCWLSRAAWRV